VCVRRERARSDLPHARTHTHQRPRLTSKSDIALASFSLRSFAFSRAYNHPCKKFSAEATPPPTTENSSSSSSSISSNNYYYYARPEPRAFSASASASATVVLSASASALSCTQAGPRNRNMTAGYK
jgi:hypothetical protein